MRAKTIVSVLARCGGARRFRRLYPYWGDALRQMGSPFRAFEAKCGPISSLHDRACEVFAQIKCARIDYGEAHSEEAGHARFSRAIFPVAASCRTGRRTIPSSSSATAPARRPRCCCRSCWLKISGGWLQRQLGRDDRLHRRRAQRLDAGLQPLQRYDRPLAGATQRARRTGALAALPRAASGIAAALRPSSRSVDRSGGFGSRGLRTICGERRQSPPRHDAARRAPHARALRDFRRELLSLARRLRDDAAAPPALPPKLRAAGSRDDRETALWRPLHLPPRRICGAAF